MNNKKIKIKKKKKDGMTPGPEKERENKEPQHRNRARFSTERWEGGFPSEGAGTGSQVSLCPRHAHTLLITEDMVLSKTAQVPTFRKLILQ
jgi:hypothetical protein